MVRVVHWNARRLSVPGLPIVRHIGTRANNFGDLLSPVVVEAVARQCYGIEPDRSSRGGRLLAIGSILHFAKDGDVVWGSGVNGKVSLDRYRARSLDIRAVRGPLTRKFMAERFRIDVPEVFGDPGVLARRLFPNAFSEEREIRRKVLLLPNLNDARAGMQGEDVASPRRPFTEVLRDIRSSESVVTSSLHGLVLSELAGVPVALVRTKHEPPFKYDDYFLGTDRPIARAYDSYEEGTRAVQAQSCTEFDTEAIEQRLIAAFPDDLWPSATRDHSA